MLFTGTILIAIGYGSSSFASYLPWLYISYGVISGTQYTSSKKGYIMSIFLGTAVVNILIYFKTKIIFQLDLK